MYEFLQKLLMAQQVSFKEGHVQFLGENVSFTPVSFLKEITNQYLEDGDIHNLYLASWKAGYKITYKMVQKYGLKKFEERYRVAMDTVSMMGLGTYTTREFERAQYAHFDVFENPLAEMLKPSQDPVCHFLRGANGGGGTIVHEVIINCIEEKCLAQGAPNCAFFNLNMERLRRYVNQDLVKKQLDLDFLLAEEKRFIKSLGHDSFISLD